MSTYYTLACDERRVRIELPGGPDYWLDAIDVPGDDPDLGDAVDADVLRAAVVAYTESNAGHLTRARLREGLMRRVEALIVAMGDGAWRIYDDSAWGCVPPRLKEFEEIAFGPDVGREPGPPMTADDILAALADGATFGPKTDDHPILDSFLAAQAHIRASKQEER